MVLNAHNKM